MKKKTAAVSMCFALVSLVAVAQAAFAAPPGKPDSSQHGGVQEKAKKSGSSSSSSQDGGGKGHKVTICHNGHLISIAARALPAHQKHDGGDPTAINGEDCSTDTQGQQRLPEEEVETMTPEDSTEQTTTDVQSEGEKEESNTEKVKACDGKSIKLNKEEKRTLELHNETRKEQGLKSLCVDPTLTKAARAHSKVMAERNHFGHDSPNGETPGERLKRSGYRWAASGENLAWGTGRHAEPEDAFERWMKSEGHKKNILDKNFEEVGIGTATKGHKGKEDRTFYTVDFGNKL